MGKGAASTIATRTPPPKDAATVTEPLLLLLPGGRRLLIRQAEVPHHDRTRVNQVRGTDRIILGNRQRVFTVVWQSVDQDVNQHARRNTTARDVGINLHVVRH